MISTKFLQENYMFKINTKEAKPKQIKSMIPKLLKTQIWGDSKPVGPLIVHGSFFRLEFENWAKIANPGQNFIFYEIYIISFEFRTLVVRI